ncbi:MAG: hypothetical protein JO351_04065, partial [Candidatus Eremiobacteraeota bacterium]|nr:hypothetical protein [Candidatus Eremiobacteraeota bacterium]
GGLVYYKGAIYGVTSAGGAKNAGTIFRMTLAGKETVLYSFGGGYDGVSPSGTLASVNGVLFGTTSGGGTNGKGTVYAMRP